jgi:hypothetical protein
MRPLLCEHLKWVWLLKEAGNSCVPRPYMFSDVLLPNDILEGRGHVVLELIPCSYHSS